MLSEKSFETQVKAWLTSLGVYQFGTPKSDITTPAVGYWEKRWGGGQYSKSGLPDMHITIKGQSIDAELKTDDGTPSELQALNIELIVNGGADAFFLAPTQKGVKHLEDYLLRHYPDYDVQVIDYEQFKRLVNIILGR